MTSKMGHIHEGFTEANRRRLPSELFGMPSKMAMEEEPIILAAVCAIWLDNDDRLHEAQSAEEPAHA